MNTRTSLSLLTLFATALSLSADIEIGPGLLGMPVQAPREARHLNFNPIDLVPGETSAGIRFTALRDGELEEIIFLSSAEDLHKSDSPAFEVEIFETDGILPTQSLGKSFDAGELSNGPRPRKALFSGIQLKKGDTYVASVSRPSTGTGDMFVTQTPHPGWDFDQDVVDLRLSNPGYGLVLSIDGGASWVDEPGKFILHGVRIDSQWQGRFYDGFWDGLSIFKSETDERVIAQNFNLELPDNVTAAKPTSVEVVLRSTQGLSGQEIKLKAVILSQSDGIVLAEGTIDFNFPDSTGFHRIEIPFTTADPLSADDQLVLCLGLADAASTSPEDFIFVRAPAYTLGNPKPSQLTWQGSEAAALLAPSFELPRDQTPLLDGLIDLPFILRLQSEN